MGNNDKRMEELALKLSEACNEYSFRNVIEATTHILSFSIQTASDSQQETYVLLEYVYQKIKNDLDGSDESETKH